MKLHFKKSGEGKPLIILHGLFGMSDNWATLSKQFSQKGLSVYVADARNHGRSPHSEEFSYNVMAEDMVRLMNDEQIASAYVIGHSMGGKTAMWLACMHPERVTALIVADMAPRSYPPHHQSVLAAIHAVNAAFAGTRKEAEAVLRQTLHDEGTVQFLLKNLYWDENEKLDWRFNLEGIESNISAMGNALPEEYVFKGPALFLRGEKSGYITDDDVSLIKKHFPQAEVKTVPNAGHWIHAENPGGFMDAVSGLLFTS